MKRIILVTVFSMFAFACKKERICSCVIVSSQGMKQNIEFTVHQTKSEAKRECELYNGVLRADSSVNSCELK